MAFKLVEVNDGVPIDKWFELQVYTPIDIYSASTNPQQKQGRKKKDKVAGEMHIQLLFLDPDENMLGEEFSNPLQVCVSS